MKTVKASLSILIVLLVVFSIIGCTSNQEPVKSESPSETLNETASVEPTETEKQYVIGFDNLGTEYEFFMTVEKGMKEAAEKNGVKLLIAYGEWNAQKVNSNIESFVLQGADLIIDFNVLPEVGNVISESLAERGIPFISIDCVYEGAYFYGVNNSKTGGAAGTFAADWIKENWGGQLDCVAHIYAESGGPELKTRNSAASDAIKENIDGFTDDKIIWINAEGKGDANEGMKLATDFLTSHPNDKHIYFQILDDNLAVGVLAAVEAANRSEDCIIISVGASTSALENLRKPEANSWVGSVAAFPEKYGENVIAYALDILNGKNPPMERYTDDVVISRENIDQYYPVN